MSIIKDGGKYLITLDNWFVAPDGDQYRAAYGVCKILKTDKVLGFNPTRSTNWFVQVGEGDGALLVAGCQIHYVVKTDKEPPVEVDGKDDKKIRTVYIPK